MIRKCKFKCDKGTRYTGIEKTRSNNKHQDKLKIFFSNILPLILRDLTSPPNGVRVNNKN